MELQNIYKNIANMRIVENPAHKWMEGAKMPHLFSYRDEAIYCHHTVDLHPDPEAFSMHAHEGMEIFYFISGAGSYLVEGNLYPLKPHDILILRPAETHKLNISSEVPYERISIHFSPGWLQGIDPGGRLLQPFLDRPLGYGNRFPAELDPEGKLRRIFSDFTFEHISDVPLNVMGRVLQLLTALSGLYEAEALQPHPEQGLERQLVAYVNDHLFEDISLQSVSDGFFRSRSQISRLFHKATGSSFWEYVTIKRLMAARAMIQRGESAGKAAAACGFADYSTFFRAYKTQFGHAPREDGRKE